MCAILQLVSAPLFLAPRKPDISKTIPQASFHIIGPLDDLLFEMGFFSSSVSFRDHFCKVDKGLLFEMIVANTVCRTFALSKIGVFLYDYSKCMRIQKESNLAITANVWKRTS